MRTEEAKDCPGGTRERARAKPAESLPALLALDAGLVGLQGSGTAFRPCIFFGGLDQLIDQGARQAKTKEDPSLAIRARPSRTRFDEEVHGLTRVDES